MTRTLLPVLLILLFSSATDAVAQQRKGDMRKPFVFAQQFKHSFGAGASFYRVGDGSEPVFHLDYNPSLSLTKSWSDFSFAIATQLSGGYHFASSADDSAFAFASIPLLAEFNFGHNASKDFYSDLGWFLGGGYTYQLVRGDWNHGPLATIGVRGFVFGPSFTIRYSRYFAIAESDVSLHSVSLLLNLGRYFEQVKLNNKVSRFSNGFRK